MSSLPFTAAQVDTAYEEWGFNCGPGALCAVLSLTPDQLRPHLVEFEQKRFMNPTHVFSVLRRLDIRHRLTYKGDEPSIRYSRFPRYGLVRVQFDGPWTKPDVPIAARYKHTHWISVQRDQLGGIVVFDVNAMEWGGWLPWTEWEEKVLSLLLSGQARATGQWWATHSIEIRV